MQFKHMMREEVLEELSKRVMERVYPKDRRITVGDMREMLRVADRRLFIRVLEREMTFD